MLTLLALLLLVLYVQSVPVMYRICMDSGNQHAFVRSLLSLSLSFFLCLCIMDAECAATASSLPPSSPSFLHAVPALLCLCYIAEYHAGRWRMNWLTRSTALAAELRRGGDQSLAGCFMASEASRPNSIFRIARLFLARKFHLLIESRSSYVELLSGRACLRLVRRDVDAIADYAIESEKPTRRSYLDNSHATGR